MEQIQHFQPFWLGFMDKKIKILPSPFLIFSTLDSEFGTRVDFIKVGRRA
jgi:hypothetical protein